MRIIVRFKPSSRGTYVKKLDDSFYEVAVKEPPVKGFANTAIIEAIAEFFKIARSRVKIVSGWTSRRKILEISEK